MSLYITIVSMQLLTICTGAYRELASWHFLAHLLRTEVCPRSIFPSGGADRIDTYPIRIFIQFLWIGTDRLSNPENLDRIGSDRQFFPLLSISNSGICLA